MLPHIREHSLAVARAATSLALAAARAGIDVDVQLTRASALLHDIAKTYTIRHGGNHSQLGGAWMREATGNPLLAMGIVHHVHWPWTVDVRAYFLPMAIIYSDKRVRHDTVVTLDERFEDLYSRYGSTQYIRDRITESRHQAEAIETALSQTLGMNLHEDSFDSGRLVERA
jgi:putative nucleotidyltransferase with HDIG domain